MSSTSILTVSSCSLAILAAIAFRPQSILAASCCALAGLSTVAFVPSGALAAQCPVSHADLQKALKASVPREASPTNGGMGNNE